MSQKEKKEYQQKVLDIARVTRVVKGGRRFRFRAVVAVGNKKGKVGVAVAKGADVSEAIEKAGRKAEKNLIKVPIVKGTIPYQIQVKYKSAKVLLKPGKKERGIVAGGAVRVIAELAGLKDVSSKILGSANKLNNARATIIALSKLHATTSIKRKKV